ncbi:MAG: hypothetical protein L0Y75_07630 [Acidobacteria bacterium]|nr:hypothetical protein [Acidobacteriota bacterium]
MNQFEYQEFYERNLPHFQPPEATLFVTFRLDGSLPQAALNQSLPADTDEEVCQVVLASIMDSLKGWTARRCNRALNRRGQFWQHESYDHVIRNQPEWERVVNYVVNNPVKAGLVTGWPDWKWTYCRQPRQE